MKHYDDGDLQIYSENLFNIFSRAFKMFCQFLVTMGDTGNFFGEIAAYEQCNFC